MSTTATYAVTGMTCAHCVVDAARTGGDEAEVKVREASDAIARLVRS